MRAQPQAGALGRCVMMMMGRPPPTLSSKALTPPFAPTLLTHTHIRMDARSPKSVHDMWEVLEGRANWWDSYYRFTYAQYTEDLLPILDLPEYFCVSGHSCDAGLAVLMLLSKLSAPRSVSPDLERLYRQGKDRISRFISAALEHVFRVCAHTFVFDTRRLKPKIPFYSYKVATVLGVTDVARFDVAFFVDGVFNPFGKPTHGYVANGGRRGGG